MKQLIQQIRSGRSVVMEVPLLRVRPGCLRVQLSASPVSAGTGRMVVEFAEKSLLESENIEARPVWKPMHQQPVFSGYPIRGGSVAAELFDQGLCLPSGSGLLPAEQTRVIDAVLAACHA